MLPNTNRCTCKTYERGYLGNDWVDVLFQHGFTMVTDVFTNRKNQILHTYTLFFIYF